VKVPEGALAEIERDGDCALDGDDCMARRRLWKLGDEQCVRIFRNLNL